MQKTTFKNCLKLGLIFFVTQIFLSSCQNDEQILEEQIAEEQINDFEQKLLKQKGKLKNNQAVIEAAKNWFEQNPNENNFTALEYLKEIDWNTAFVTFNNNTFAVEVPLYFKKDFNLIPVQKSKKKEKNYLKKEKTFSRLLFLPSNNSEKPFSSYLTNFYLDNSKTQKKISSNINYFHIHNSFKGKIAIIDDNNNLIEFKDTAKKTNKQQYLAKVAPMEVTCVWFGWWYEDGHFEPISLVGCSSGSDYNPDTYGYYSNYGGGGSGGSSSSNDNEPLPIEPDQIINNLTDKADCVYGKLQGNSLLTKTLEKFVGEETPVHLIINQQSNLTVNGDLVNGSTQYGNSFYITIILNTEQANNRPSLDVARTILHEAIHAEIFRKIKTTSGLHQNLSGEWELGSGAIADFPTLFDYYEKHNDPQHEYMANYYRTAMEEGLKEYAISIGESYPDQLYKDLAWNGLRDTYAWANMYADYNYTLSEQERIKEAVNNFLKNKTNECQ